MNHRDHALDRLRLWLTFFVVFGHALVLFTSARSLMVFDVHPVANSLQQWLYSFHIPAFFMVSGATYHSRKPIVDFVVGKAKRLLVPYFLTFYIVMMPTLYLVGQWKWSYVTEVWLNHDARHLWFLYTLFTLAVALRLLDGMRVPYAATLLLASILYFMPLTPSMPWRFAAYFLFYVLGVAFARYGKKLSRYWPLWLLVHIVCYYAILQEGHLKPWLAHDFFSRVMVIGVTVSLWFVLYALAKMLPNIACSGLYEGQYGLYLYHAPWIYLLAYYMAPHIPIPWYATVWLLFIFAVLLSYASEALRRRLCKGFSQ